MFIHTCPKCGEVSYHGYDDLPKVPQTVLCPNCKSTVADEFLTLDQTYKGHGGTRHGAQSLLAEHRKRLEEHPKLLASTRYSTLEYQYKALNDIMDTLNNVEVFQSMVREGLKIVFVIEHGVPVDDGCVRSSEGITEIGGLTRSKAVFRAGEYQHPLTYFPTWQEVTKL